MSKTARQFGMLLPLVIVVLTTSSVEAGFLSIDDEAQQFIVESSSEVSASDSEQAADKDSRELSIIEKLGIHQLGVGNLSTSGMSSSSSVSANGSSNAPSAMLNQAVPQFLGLVSPLCLREPPFTPQQMISGIFRPPCS